MTRYLLDTDALIDFSKGREPARSLILGWIDGQDVVALSAVTVAEFYTGLDPNQADDWTPFIRSLEYWDIDVETAIGAGQDRRAARLRGETVAISDAMIGAVAEEQGATLVTGNARHDIGEGIAVFPLGEGA